MQPTVIHTAWKVYIRGFQISSQPVGKGTSQSERKLPAACSTDISSSFAGARGNQRVTRWGQGTYVLEHCGGSKKWLVF